MNLYPSGAIASINENEFLVGYGPCKWASEPAEVAFYFPDFFLSKHKPWLIPDRWEIKKKNEIQIQASYSEKLTWNQQGKALFQNAFSDFFRTNLEKAVPYVFEHSTQLMSNELFNHMLESLIAYSKNHLVHVYGFWHENEGMLGASPELLFRVRNPEQLETVACAGTAKVQKFQDLHNDKDLYEHKIVVKGILESIAPLGEVTIEATEIVKLATLAHLITPIKVKLSQPFSFQTIINSLHPTPALGAFPFKQGKTWLKDYQQMLDRGRYGAPAGSVFNGISSCYVAIRNIQWDKNGLYIGAGCGIVKGSDFHKEWNEIELKMHSIKEIFNL